MRLREDACAGDRASRRYPQRSHHCLTQVVRQTTQVELTRQAVAHAAAASCQSRSSGHTSAPHSESCRATGSADDTLGSCRCNASVSLPQPRQSTLRLQRAAPGHGTRSMGPITARPELTEAYHGRFPRGRAGECVHFIVDYARAHGALPNGAAAGTKQRFPTSCSGPPCRGCPRNF